MFSTINNVDRDNVGKYASFPDIQDAIKACPPDDDTYTYRYLWSNLAKGYTIGKYQGGNLIGLMEKEDA